MMATRNAVRAQLERRLAGLLRRAGKIEGDLTQAHDRDSEERATELENDEVLEGLDALTLEEIRQIRTALRNIETGPTGCAQPADGPSIPSVWPPSRARSRALRALYSTFAHEVLAGPDGPVEDMGERHESRLLQRLSRRDVPRIAAGGRNGAELVGDPLQLLHQVRPEAAAS